MPEFTFSSTSRKNGFSSHLFSDLFHFCFSIFSHPLYFSYFLFFSPYLLRLLSFLSPLVITTTLLLIALLTVTPNLVYEKDSSSEFPESKWGSLLSVFQTFMEWLLSKADDKDEEIGFLDEFEAYLVMLQASIFEVLEPKSEGDCSEGFEAADAEYSGEERREDFGPMEEPIVTSDQNPVEKLDKMEATRSIAEVRSLESLFQENEELEDMPGQKEEDKEVKPLDPEFYEVEESKDKLPMRSGSKVMGNRDIDAKVSINNVGECAAAVKVKSEGLEAKLWSPESNWEIDAKVSNYSAGEYAAAVKAKSQRLEANFWGSPESNWEYSGKVIGNNQTRCSSLGSFGSMRSEKEWRRTLACKLFEERHNADGSEGMDMLWETYETESNKVLQKSNTKKGKKGEIEYSEDDEEEEEDLEGKLCCLQALKFSAGKMNLGMGRPNFLKISKALKGIGWLHHVGRHGRKGNH